MGISRMVRNKSMCAYTIKQLHLLSEEREKRIPRKSRRMVRLVVSDSFRKVLLTDGKTYVELAQCLPKKKWNSRCNQPMGALDLASVDIDWFTRHRQAFFDIFHFQISMVMK